MSETESSIYLQKENLNLTDWKTIRELRAGQNNQVISVHTSERKVLMINV